MVERFERFSFVLSEISRHWHKLTAAEMDRYGLKGSHSVYLLAMRRYPEGVTASQLCDLCGRDKSDVSRTMAILARRGLVTKEGVHQNRYAGEFKLTAEGHAAAEYVGKCAALAVALAGKDLDEVTRTIFYNALESIAGNLRELSVKGLPNP